MFEKCYFCGKRILPWQKYYELTVKGKCSCGNCPEEGKSLRTHASCMEDAANIDEDPRNSNEAIAHKRSRK